MFPMFVGRVLPFDMACTNAYADMLVKMRAAGSSIGTADACIAAIAIAHGFTVATRDTGPFRAVGLPVISPWESA